MFTHSSSRCGLLLALLVLMLVFTPVPGMAQNFTIIALPDTQGYTDSYPATFTAQTEWIANNISALNIKAVVGLGDIAEGAGDLTQWANADSSMRVLEGRVPYFMVIGNHDYDNDDPQNRTASTKNFNAYFGPMRYAHSYSGYGGSYIPGSNENFYGMLTINGKQYIFLLLEFYPRIGALRWAAEVIRSNPKAEIIVVTHGYENYDNTRVALCDQYNAEYYGLGADNDGDEMWVNLVSQFPNVSLVLSGHIIYGSQPAAGRETEPGFAGNIVNEELSNYQNLPNGGNGYLRILQFEPSSNKIVVKTYSPTLDSYLTDSGDSFTVPWHVTSATGTGTIKGRVKNTSCSAVAGAIVSYSGGSTVTDSSGNFTLANVSPGTKTVRVQAAGYPAITKQVPVAVSRTSNPLFFVSTLTGSVSGQITDLLTGVGIANATVSSSGQSTTADSSGAYTLTPVSTGSAQLTASATGYANLTQQISVTSGMTSTMNFPLSATSVYASGKVTGVIKNALTGSGIPGANILYSEGSAVTDANGKYTLSGVPIGTVSFTVSALGMRTLVGNVTILGNQTVTKNFSLTPVPTGSVSGTVMDTYTDLPIPWATVGYSGGNTGTDASGRYTLTLVPTGTQLITASDTGHQSQSQSVSVAQNGTTTRNFSLLASAVGTLQGTVSDASSGNPILGASVTFEGGNALTNSTGAYSLTNVPAGTGELEATAAGYLSNELNVTVMANQTTTQNVALSPVQPGGTVAGTVTDGSAPLSGALVSYAGGNVTSASDGSFSFADVPPGNQVFTITKTGYNSSTQTVSVVSGQTSTLNVVLTRRTGTITGKITNASTGAALSGATISVAGMSTSSSTTGTYTLSGVLSGSYTLTVTKTGWLPNSVAVTVTAGSTVTVNLGLATSGMLAGTVTMSGGSLDPGVTVTLKGGVIATTVTLTTNSSGAYKSSWIAVGSYTVTISQSGHTTQTKSATVTAGATTTVNFTGF